MTSTLDRSSSDSSISSASSLTPAQADDTHEDQIVEGGTETSPFKPFVKKRGVRATTTWHLEPPHDWKTTMMHTDLGPEEIYWTAPKPEGKLPHQPVWRENVFILSHAGGPLLLQAGWYYLFPAFKWPLWFAVIYYTLWTKTFTIAHVQRLARYQGIYGVFDQENRGRDMVPDSNVTWVASSLLFFMFGRTFGLFALGWDANEFPTVSWWWPAKVIIWGLFLDFFFYCYHRACHEVPWLWSIHQRHHASHHPTPILSIYADGIQEFIEVAIIPYVGTKTLELMTGTTLTFAELYLALAYLVYAESTGHSGIRAVWGSPLNYYVLRPFGMELLAEDHDIHHRDGKGGRNYGKQSRVWDKFFGTIERRRELQTYY